MKGPATIERETRSGNGAVQNAQWRKNERLHEVCALAARMEFDCELSRRLVDSNVEMSLTVRSVAPWLVRINSFARLASSARRSGFASNSFSALASSLAAASPWTDGS